MITAMMLTTAATTTTMTTTYRCPSSRPGKRLLSMTSHHSSSQPKSVDSDHKCAEGPLAQYVQRVEEGLLEADPLQVSAVEKLQDLYDRLQGYEPPPLQFFDDRDKRQQERANRIAKKKTEFLKQHGNDAALPDFGAEDPADSPFLPPKGLYLHGPVGCGKTLLLDLFFDGCQTDRKLRVHFHAFLLNVHSELNRWRLQSGDEDVRPLEAIARKMIEDNWLICFDEVQHTDYGSSVLLHQLFAYMLSRGAVIVLTSNRAPSELGASAFTEEQEETSTTPLSAMAQLLVDSNDVSEMPSQTDYRTRQSRGKPCYFYPNDDHASRMQMDEAFEDVLRAAGSSSVGPSHVTVYGRHVPLPVACEEAKAVRCSFKHLFQNPPLGPADYLAICNKFSTIFVDDVPALSINEKNEARRFLSFIDSAYETKSNVFLLAETRPDELFQLIPDEDGSAADDEDKMQMEMLGQLAYDLKADLHQKAVDLRSLGILTGQDEIFSFKRAISRINEMRGFQYQRLAHRPIPFAPYAAAAGEAAMAEARRHQREARRREELDGAVYPENTKAPMMNLSSEWGSEASYEVWSVENMNTYNLRKTVEAEKRKDAAPKFPEQHFYGAGWWETVVNKVRGQRRKKKDEDEDEKEK